MRKLVILALVFLIPLASASLEISSSIDNEDKTIELFTPASSASSTTFLDLLDTPSSYSGAGDTCVMVNAGENALEFNACNISGGAVGGGFTTDQNDELNTTGSPTFASVITKNVSMGNSSNISMGDYSRIDFGTSGFIESITISMSLNALQNFWFRINNTISANVIEDGVQFGSGVTGYNSTFQLQGKNGNFISWWYDAEQWLDISDDMKTDKAIFFRNRSENITSYEDGNLTISSDDNVEIESKFIADRFATSPHGTIEFNFTNDGENVLLDMGKIAGNNYFGIGTDGAFLQLYSNPNPAIDYLLFTVTETQGADTFLNFYEGGTGHNRFWDSGSMRIGGGASYLCSNLTTDVDCDTPLTGADLVVQDDGWFGGKLFSSDWSNVTITESQISDLVHAVDTNETGRVTNLTGDDCSVGEFVTGVDNDGNLVCTTGTATPTTFNVDRLIYAPDYIDDDVALLHVSPEIYPNGINLTKIELTVSAEASYSIDYETWARATPYTTPSLKNQVGTVATNSTMAYNSSTTSQMTNSTLPSDYYLYLDIGTIDVDWIHVKAIYEVL